MPVKISTLHRGAVFLAELRRKVLLDGLTLAIPEPDLGDDLWVVDLSVAHQADCDDDSCGVEPQLFRFQVKSAVSTAQSGDKKYTINLTKSYKKRICQRFYWLIGLYDPDMADNFHVGCVPSTFFRKLSQEGKLRPTKQGRIMMDFFVTRPDKDPQYSYFLRLRIGRKARIDVSRFFLRPQGSLRRALLAAKTGTDTVCAKHPLDRSEESELCDYPQRGIP